MWSRDAPWWMEQVSSSSWTSSPWWTPIGPQAARYVPSCLITSVLHMSSLFIHSVNWLHSTGVHAHACSQVFYHIFMYSQRPKVRPSWLRRGNRVNADDLDYWTGGRASGTTVQHVSHFTHSHFINHLIWISLLDTLLFWTWVVLVVSPERRWDERTRPAGRRSAQKSAYSLFLSL